MVMKIKVPGQYLIKKQLPNVSTKVLMLKWEWIFTPIKTTYGIVFTGYSGPGIEDGTSTSFCKARVTGLIQS